jgi:hypothetical protein
VLLGPLAILPLFLLQTGCGAREEVPIVMEDSTLVYPPKEGDGPSARITFCKRYSKKTGKMRGVGTVFERSPKGRVYAVVKLLDWPRERDKTYLLHLAWLNPDGSLIFKKMIRIAPEDTTTVLRSRISIPPERREPGTYRFQVYLFRELMAEKAFRLR